MRELVISIFFSHLLIVTAQYSRRHLVPKTLAQKLCEKDSSLSICLLPEVTKPRNPVTIWGICQDHPHLLLCKFRPPATFPQVYDLTTAEPEPEIERRTEDIFVTNEFPEFRTSVDARHALMTRVLEDIVKEKQARQRLVEQEENFDDNIMIGGGSVFDDIRLI